MTLTMSEQIKVSEQNWKFLNALKEPGDTFDDAVDKLRDGEEVTLKIEGAIVYCDE